MFNRYNTNRYSPDRMRIDDFRLLGEFINELNNLGTDIICEWLIDKEEDVLIEPLFGIRKANGKLEIFSRFLEEDIENFKASSTEIVELIYNFNELKYKKVPKAVAIIYEKNLFYLKPFYDEVTCFRRLKRSEFDLPVGTYLLSGYERGDNIAAIGLLLCEQSVLKEVIANIFKENFFITYSFGVIKKEQDIIFIKYEKSELKIVFEIKLPTRLFEKIVGHYQNFVYQQIESFLFFKSNNDYIFMANPLEEIKVEFNKLIL